MLNTSQNLIIMSNNFTHPNHFSCPHLNSMENILCAGPPTAVHNLRVIYATTTSISIQWDLPLVTGRPDYFYNVEYSSPNDILQYIQHNQEKITPLGYIMSRDYNLSPHMSSGSVCTMEWVEMIVPMMLHEGYKSVKLHWKEVSPIHTLFVFKLLHLFAQLWKCKSWGGAVNLIYKVSGTYLLCI